MCTSCSDSVYGSQKGQVNTSSTSQQGRQKGEHTTKQRGMAQCAASSALDIPEDPGHRDTLDHNVTLLLFPQERVSQHPCHALSELLCFEAPGADTGSRHAPLRPQSSAPEAKHPGFSLVVVVRSRPAGPSKHLGQVAESVDPQHHRRAIFENPGLRRSRDDAGDLAFLHALGSRLRPAEAGCGPGRQVSSESRPATGTTISGSHHTTLTDASTSTEAT